MGTAGIYFWLSTVVAMLGATDSRCTSVWFFAGMDLQVSVGDGKSCSSWSFAENFKVLPVRVLLVLAAWSLARALWTATSAIRFLSLVDQSLWHGWLSALTAIVSESLKRFISALRPLRHQIVSTSMAAKGQVRRHRRLLAIATTLVVVAAGLFVGVDRFRQYQVAAAEAKAGAADLKAAEEGAKAIPAVIDRACQDIDQLLNERPSGSVADAVNDAHARVTTIALVTDTYVWSRLSSSDKTLYTELGNLTGSMEKLTEAANRGPAEWMSHALVIQSRYCS